jgi:hypothetical protein
VHDVPLPVVLVKIPLKGVEIRLEANELSLLDWQLGIPKISVVTVEEEAEIVEGKVK